MPDMENARALAVMAERFDNFEALLLSIRTEIKAVSADQEVRLRVLENVRVPAIENRVVRVEERQGAIAVGQGIFTTIAAAIAGWFGSSR